MCDVRVLPLLLAFAIGASAQSEDPCADSLYLRLKSVPLDSMSTRQYDYFMQKDRQCAGGAAQRSVQPLTRPATVAPSVATPEEPWRLYASLHWMVLCAKNAYTGAGVEAGIVVHGRHYFTASYTMGPIALDPNRGTGSFVQGGGADYRIRIAKLDEWGSLTAGVGCGYWTAENKLDNGEFTPEGWDGYDDFYFGRTEVGLMIGHNKAWMKIEPFFYFGLMVSYMVTVGLVVVF